MRALRLAVLVVPTLALLIGSAQADRIRIVPTTTRAAETGNNTSAPDAFAGFTNGTSPAGNVSKLPVSQLLYPGSTTRIHVAVMGWWGRADHIDVGYRSDDPLQAARQVADMRSRGISGAILTWYGGVNNMENRAAFELMRASEQQPGFEFSIMVDGGALKWNSCSGCSPTDALIRHLNYVAQNFFPSPAYMRIGGRPVVFEFGLEAYTIDWARVKASVPGSPLYIFRNATGLARPGEGAYAWGASEGLSYNDYFYSQALKYPGKLIWGGAGKGFDDSIASWTKNRRLDQRCGQLWLDKLSQAGTYYSALNQLPFMQLISWNDYEEGTSLETGIDSCLSLTAAQTAGVLTWELTGGGTENTIDHYRVLASLDGESLMPLAELPAGSRSLNLASFALAPADYILYVQAIGKSSIRNLFSEPVSYSVPNMRPVAALTLSASSGVAPMSLTASTLGSADEDGYIAASVIDFGNGSKVNGSSASTTLLAGTYTVQATVIDDLGASSTASALVTVVPPSVAITNPKDGASVKTSVRLLATASSGRNITGMRVYVDGVDVFYTQSSTLDATLRLNPGWRNIIVKAWDASGASFSSAVRIKAAK